MKNHHILSYPSSPFGEQVFQIWHGNVAYRFTDKYKRVTFVNKGKKVFFQKTLNKCQLKSTAIG